MPRYTQKKEDAIKRRCAIPAAEAAVAAANGDYVAPAERYNGVNFRETIESDVIRSYVKVGEEGA